MYGTENWDTQHSSELPYIVIPTNGIKCVSLCKTNRNMTNSQKIFLKGTTKNEEDTISYSGARHAKGRQNGFRVFLRPFFEVGKKDIKKGFGKISGLEPLPKAF